MFVNHCTHCDKSMLIFPSQVTGMAKVDGVVAMTYTCWCGTEQLWHEGMKNAQATLTTAVAATA